MVAQMLPAIGQIVGSVISAKMQAKAQEKANLKNSLAYKIAEAKAAGIHPLAMLGSSYAGSSPNISVGAPDLGKMGQSLGGAMAKGLDETSKSIQTLTLEKVGLENEMLRAQIAKTKQEAASIPPSTIGSRYMIDGQGQTASPSGVPGVLVQDEPLKRVVGAPEQTSQEPGAVTDVGFTKTKTGYFPVKSRDAQQRLEDDAWGNFMWNWRNRIAPSPIGSHNPPPVAVPPGFDGWAWNAAAFEYQPYKMGRGGFKYFPSFSH